MTARDSRQERRRHPRLRALLLLNYMNRDGAIQRSAVSMARTLDVSRSGAQVEVLEPLETGAHLQLSIAVRDEEVSVCGRVTHVTQGARGRFKMGIQFDELLAEALIARLLD